MDANIITECYADTLLAETVAPPKKGYNHQHACSNVLKTMRTSLINQFALGIIDDDKVVPKEFGEFELVKKHNNSLALYKHCNRPHYIIKISKAVEDFILNTATPPQLAMFCVLVLRCWAMAQPPLNLVVLYNLCPTGLLLHHAHRRGTVGTHYLSAFGMNS